MYGSDCCAFTWYVCVRLLRYDEHQSRAVFATPNRRLSTDSNVLWSTVSKAAMRSSSTTAHTSLALYKLFTYLFTYLITYILFLTVPHLRLLQFCPDIPALYNSNGRSTERHCVGKLSFADLLCSCKMSANDYSAKTEKVCMTLECVLIIVKKNYKPS